MRYSILIPCLCSLLFFSACHAPAPSKKELDAHMPPSFEEYFEPLDTELPEDVPAPKNAWELSDSDVSYIDRNKKLIAFSFDDAPSRTLESIFAVFAAYNEQNPDCTATASLFVNGGLVEEASLPLLYTANMLGFELANHTHSHFDLTTLQESELREEIDRTDEILAKIDGNARHLLRAPFGRINQTVKDISPAPIMNWTIDTLDWTKNSEEDIYNSVVSALFPGAIVLMHDGYEATVSALKRLLPDLKALGYQVVSVSALAKAHGCNLKIGNEYIRLRKQ